MVQWLIPCHVTWIACISCCIILPAQARFTPGLSSFVNYGSTVESEGDRQYYGPSWGKFLSKIPIKYLTEEYKELSKRPEVVDLPPEQSLQYPDEEKTLGARLKPMGKVNYFNKRTPNQYLDVQLQLIPDRVLQIFRARMADYIKQKNAQKLKNNDDNHSKDSKCADKKTTTRTKRNPRCLRTCLTIEKLNPMQCHHLC